MRTNPVKRALQAGQTVLGSELSRLRSSVVPRLFAQAGFDFVFIDTEHSTLNHETVADMIAAARSSGIVPIVRVPQCEYPHVCRNLDLGALGIIVPRVNTPQEVRNVVSWMHFPPEGIRGFADTAAQTEDEPVTADEFIAAAHREVLCVIQIERQEALDNLDEMLSVPGVDVACLGCMDLSIDLQVPGRLDHPSMVRAIEKVVATAARHGVSSGIIHSRLDFVVPWMEKGIRFVSLATESHFLRDGAAAAVRQLRAAKAPTGGRP